MTKGEKRRIQRRQQRLDKKNASRLSHKSSSSRSSSSKKVTICFAAIVRQEGKIIKRLLDSLKPIIDFISIVDTGSTDDTVKQINDWCELNKIPGKVHSDKWVDDFGYSRTVSFKKAKETYPDSTYILLLDADMILKVEKTFDKHTLWADKYDLIQVSGNLFQHNNIRIVKTALDWKCIAPTHEYWDVPGKILSSVSLGLNDLWIDDRNDGGCKEDKFVRDRRILKKFLARDDIEHFLRVRYTFYMGQTLKSLGEMTGDDSIIKESIEYYRKRVNFGGWDEEVFYSLYQIGNLYMRLKEVDKSIRAYYEAWMFRPARLESLYEIAEYYRKNAEYKMCYKLAMIMKDTKESNDKLFIETSIYVYKIDHLILMSAYYVGDMNGGKEAALRLISKEEILKKNNRLFWTHVVNNKKFYLPETAT